MTAELSSATERAWRMQCSAAYTSQAHRNSRRVPGGCGGQAGRWKRPAVAHHLRDADDAVGSDWSRRFLNVSDEGSDLLQHHVHVLEGLLQRLLARQLRLVRKRLADAEAALYQRRLHDEGNSVHSLQEAAS